MRKLPIVYAFSSGIYGICNILSVLLIFKNNSSNVHKTDLFFITLTFAAFLVSAIVGPLQAGLKQYLSKSYVSEEAIKLIENCTLSCIIVFLNVMLLFSVCFFFDHYGSWVFISMLYISSNIIFELTRYRSLVTNQFSLIMLIGLPSVTFPIFAYFISDPGAYLTYVSAIRFVSLTATKKILSGFWVNEFRTSIVLLLDFYKSHFRYMFSNLISAGSVFLPSILLGSFGVGYVSAYYFSIRFCLSPVSLFVVPFVDFFRFKFFFESVDKNKFKLALLVLSFGALIWTIIILFYSELILSIFISDEENVDLFNKFLIAMAPLVLTQTLYVLLTRTAEVDLNVNIIAICGMFGHFAFIVAIILLSFAVSDLVYYARTTLDIIYFLPLALFFSIKSSRYWVSK